MGVPVPAFKGPLKMPCNGEEAGETRGLPSPRQGGAAIQGLQGETTAGGSSLLSVLARSVFVSFVFIFRFF